MTKAKKQKDAKDMTVREMKAEIQKLAGILNRIKIDKDTTATYYADGFRMVRLDRELRTRGWNTIFVPEFAKAPKGKKAKH